MIKLAEKYGDKPAAELPMLFQCILQNTIHDYFRREKVRNTWVSLFSSMGRNNANDENYDVLETFESEDDSQATESSANKFEREQIRNMIDQEIQKLQARQQEAFLMRYWEDMEVAEIAAAMGCSEGSVKTNFSRKTNALTQSLKAKGISYTFKVRHALNENLDNLPVPTIDHLAAARKAALARKKKDAPTRSLARQGLLAGHPGNFFSDPLAWLMRVGVAAPIVAGMVLLSGLYQ